MTREQMLRHAQEWVAAWNRRDLDAVLEPFAPDAVFVSPRAEAVTGGAVVRGKQALRRYWEEALSRVTCLRFELIGVVCDEAQSEMVVTYFSIRNGVITRACELMRFAEGRQVYGEALYGVKQDGSPTASAVPRSG